MNKGSKADSRSASHKIFKDNEKNRVANLVGVFDHLREARKESRNTDAVFLEKQVEQMLREWKAELDQPSPASSLNGGSLEPLKSLSSDICRMLRFYEEEDDAISPFKDIGMKPGPEPEAFLGGSLGSLESLSAMLRYYEEKDDAISPLKDSNTMKPSLAGVVQVNDSVDYPQDCNFNQASNASLQWVDKHEGNLLEICDVADNDLEVSALGDYSQFSLPQDFEHLFSGTTLPDNPSISANIPPPPAAFLGPKCALWDCLRPALRFQDYCSNDHANLAEREGEPGMTPVLRPGGIGVKDSLLFTALSAMSEGKRVGIPHCEGAATAKSPWNAPELFDMSVLNGETIREWLFFDKPRRAFESGNRKQRSLPDYSGRGWHESRQKEEPGGVKRSYYMDPQPLQEFEWHLFEYEINEGEGRALYHLRFKRSEKKKNSRGKKATNDSVADLQKQMDASMQLQADSKSTARGRRKVNMKGGAGNVQSISPNEVAPSNPHECGWEAESNFPVKNLDNYYGT